VRDSTNQKIYFPGLNGLRFIAAFVVVLGHTEQLKVWFGLPPAPVLWSSNSPVGDYAVTLFFTLSGFLITYLLLAEQQQTGTIQVRKFYVRRILRIWPLYYLLVLIGFMVFPAIIAGLQDYSGPRGTYTHITLIGHLLILPNITMYLGALPAISHLWTIGVEEQFYLMWPPLMRRFNLPRLLIGIIVLKLVIHTLSLMVVNPPIEFNQVIRFMTRFRIESMAVGGLGAYLLFSQHRALRVIFHPLVEKAILIVVIGHLLFAPTRSTTPEHLALSALYMLFMLNVACNPQSTVSLVHPILNRLGQMSYGIYMYHLAVIYLVIIGLRQLGAANDLLVYGLVTTLTIGIAALSYDHFERPFLNLKKRFAVLDTGDLSQIKTAENPATLG
jgi:peptidoglycan/LPS O-acetylase OafA/YrhL